MPSSLEQILEKVLPRADWEIIEDHLEEQKSFEDILGTFPYGETRRKLSLINALLDISKYDFTWVEKVVTDEKVRTLSDAAEHHYLDPIPQPWKKELFRLQSTSVLKSLILSEAILIMSSTQDLVGSTSSKEFSRSVTELVVAILQHAVVMERDISKDPFTNFVDGYKFPKDVSNEIRSTAIERIKDLQRLQALVLEPEELRPLFAMLDPGQRSAAYIASCNRDKFNVRFTELAKDDDLSAKVADAIYIRAVIVQMRNEQAWATMLRQKTELRLPAIAKDDGPSNEMMVSKESEDEESDEADSEEEETNEVESDAEGSDTDDSETSSLSESDNERDGSSVHTPNEPTGNLRTTNTTRSPNDTEEEQAVNFVNLFHETETVECSDCESVLSPAAYLVDLLKTLREVKVQGETTLFDNLIDRRPDLKDLELSCANTKVLIPYIDLVNEVLESFIVHHRFDKNDKVATGIEAYNMNDSDTSLRCEQEPRNIKSNVYESYITTKYSPSKYFPYNQAIDSTRAFLEALGSSLATLRQALGTEYRLIKDRELGQHDEEKYMPSFNREAVLEATREMVKRAIVAERLGLQEEDMLAVTREGFLPSQRLQQCHPDHLAIQQEDFEELVDFPGTCALWGYPSTVGGLRNMLDMTAKQGLSFVKENLLPRSGLSFDELVKVLCTQYFHGRLILTPSDGSSQFTNKLDDMRLRTSPQLNDIKTLEQVKEINEVGALTEDLCFELQAFLRLRNRLGWSIPLLDAALTCLTRDRSPSETRITPRTLQSLDAIQSLSSLTTLKFNHLLPWWGNIHTTGDDSLYTELFLERTMEKDDPFLPGPDGHFLPENTTLTFSSAIPALTTALRVSQAEIQELVEAMGLPNTDPKLSLENVSHAYRVRTFCEAMKIEIMDYPLFCSVMAPPTQDLFEDPCSTSAVVQHWHTLTEAGWTLKDLSACIHNQENIIEESNAELKPSPYRGKAIKSFRSLLASLKLVIATWPTFDPRMGIPVADDDLRSIITALYGKDHVDERLNSFEELAKNEIAEDVGIKPVPATDPKRQARNSPAVNSRSSSNVDSSKKLPPMSTTVTSPLSPAEKKDWRTLKYNELVHDLRRQLLKQHIFDAINADFPEINASVIRLIMSDIASVSSGVSAMSELQRLVLSEDSDIKGSVDAFFSPFATDQYYFQNNSENNGVSLFVNDVQIPLQNKESSPVRLLSGQEYRLTFTGSLSDLSWRTDPLPFSPFPSDILLDTKTVQLAENAYESIARNVLVISTAKLGLDEIQFFTGPLGSQIINICQVSIEVLLQLQKYRVIRDTLLQSGQLLSLYKWIVRDDKIVSELGAEISQATGWPSALVSNILDAKYPSLCDHQRTELFKKIDTLVDMWTAIKFISRIGIPGASVNDLFDWAEPPQPDTNLFKKAAQLRTVAATKAPGSTGPQTAVGKAFQQLRLNQRQALVQYLMADSRLCKTLDWVDSDSLFEYLLIDVNMGPQLQTSRIKQAISTVQLFVQRLFLGMEIRPAISPRETKLTLEDLRSRWTYMAKYTLWEANRKVFLYPENWADPTLRDDKSEQFQALESAILQNDVSLESVTEAVKTYIFEVSNVAHLDIQAYLWERNAATTGRFHFFARTRTIPYQFYYRHMELSGDSFQSTYWYPWTKLDLGAPAQSPDEKNEIPQGAPTYLIPSVFHGRLFLFVPEIMLRTKQAPSEPNQEPTLQGLANKKSSQIQSQIPYWEVKMAWMERRGGKWSPKVFSPDVLTVDAEVEIVKEATNTEAAEIKNNLPPLSHFKFGVRARNPDWKAPNAADSNPMKPLRLNDTSALASYENGVECFLVIDVETYMQSGSKFVVKPHGQFEMRGSQLYRRKDTKDFPSSRAKEPKTFPTTYGKLHETNGPPPAYQLLEPVEYLIGQSEKGVPITTIKNYSRDPLLVEIEDLKAQKLSWTISSDATQFPRPLGLVVDIVSMKSGAQTYFGKPPSLEVPEGQSSTDFSSTIEVVPLEHPNADELVAAAARYTQLSSILKSLKPASLDGTDVNMRFGKINDKYYNELFAPNSVYNWELGVHAVSLLMERLLVTQQFEAALQVARLVFDPTINGGNLRDCWLFYPFADDAIDPRPVGDLLESLQPESKQPADNYQHSQIDLWSRNPFNAHSVARGRPVTYMKRIVMKYIEILIAAGDHYFRQATLEAIPLAIQRYVEASHLFGPPMQRMPRMGKREKRTFGEVMTTLNNFGNVQANLELDLPFAGLRDAPGTEPALRENPRQGLMGFVLTTYFCVPTNPQLLALRDLITDRLFKIRNGQNINGDPLRLPLFEPPIDPGMLVQAQAAGSEALSMMLNDLDSPMPNYRMVYLMQKASEMVNELKATADFFLSAREKRDGEAFARLKSQQESAIQSMTMEIKDLQKEEALRSIEALEEQRRSHVSRLKFYLALVGESPDRVPGEQDEWTDISQQIDKPTNDDLRMSINEKNEMEKANLAADLTFSASLLDTGASLLYALPNISTNSSPMGVGATMKFDAENVAKGMSGYSTALKLIAEYNANQGARSARKAQMIRQLQDRRLQANMAGREIKNVDRQIATQKARVSICEAEIKVQARQLAHARETEEWYRSKYTNEELYAWLENQSRSLLYEYYLLAIDLARKVEKAFQFECAPGKPVAFLNPRGYWDSSREGLLAAQHIQLALKRMELAYMERSPSDFEISKLVSLRQINPEALLELRLNGETTFTLPEALFDLDFPGHYFRRIKSVTVNMPCITGPYTSLNCTLSLLNHCYRISPSLPDGKYQKQGDRDDRFRTDRIPITSIAVGERSVDGGRFDLNFAGERYLPFENAGAISTWKVELPKKVRQFDYETISDVVLQIRYTSRQGGTRLRESAETAISEKIKQASNHSETFGLHACVDLKNEYSNQFLALTMESSTVDTVELTGLTGCLPFWSRGKTVKAKDITLYVQSTVNKDKQAYVGNFIIAGSAKLENGIALSESKGWTKFAAADLDLVVTDWTLKIGPPQRAEGASILKKPASGDVKQTNWKPEPIKRIFLLFRYKVVDFD